MAVPGITVPLPGGIEDYDEDLDGPRKADRGPDSRGADRPDSPKRVKSADAHNGVTMDSLRVLLAEQSVSLLQAQQLQMSTALAAFEERQAGRMDKIEHKVDDQAGAVASLEAQLKEMGERLAVVENRPQAGAGASPDRKNTLVFGGWAADTRKGTLLSQLDQALVGLDIKKELDSEPFTTGARRSVASCQFRRRPQEGDGETRQRMLRVIQIVNDSKVNIQGAPRPLWASFSKSPEERGRAALAAVVRKSVLRAAPQRLGDLDVEYPTGRSWIKDDQLSGMGTPPPEVRQSRKIMTKGGEGWLDERTLARWLDIELTDLQAIISEHKF